MEIFNLIVIIVIIPYLAAKPVSLNDIIAAEAKQTRITTHRPTQIPDTSERISLNKVLGAKPRTSKTLKTSDIALKTPVSLNDIIAAESKQNSTALRLKTSERLFRNKIPLLKLRPRKFKKLRIPESISLRKYKRKTQSQRPPKSKLLQLRQRPRYKRRNQSIKREVIKHEQFDDKYMPLLRSLSELLDNILPDGTGEASELERTINKLRRLTHKDENASTCTCKQESRNSQSSKATTAPTKTITTKRAIITEDADTSTEVPSSTASNAAFSDVSHYESNTNVPILLARDTLGTRRDDSRLSEGSSPTRHSSTKGNFSGNNGNSERDTAHGEDTSSSTDYEGDTYGSARNSTSSGQFGGGRGLRGDRDDTGSPDNRKAKKTIEELEIEDANRYSGGDFAKSEGTSEFEVGRNQAKSTTPVPQFVPGFTGPIPTGEIGHSLQFTESKEVYEESVISQSDSHARDKRIFDRDSTHTSENQKAGETNAAVKPFDDLSNTMFEVPKKVAPYVTIIDGYSVAAGKNGTNRFAEQSIRFRS